uniref:Uncharacterized protein n=1 Tax=Rhizophora mucronata TaxID=61149 RepID=A0A2P2Q3M3_RHIMU
MNTSNLSKISVLAAKKGERSLANAAKRIVK